MRTVELEAEFRKRICDTTAEASIQHACLQLEAEVIEARTKADCLAIYRRALRAYLDIGHILEISNLKADGLK